MDDPLTRALFWPFRRGLLDGPAQNSAPWLYLNARAGADMDEAWLARLVCVQPDKAHHDMLARRRFKVTGALAADDLFAGALVRLGRDRHEGRGLIADALASTVAGGLIVISGAKDEGGQSHERDVGALLALDGVVPKSGCRTFWLRRPVRLEENAAAELARWRQAARPHAHIGAYVTCPGLFSWQAIDAGSRFLGDNLPVALAGRVAELGCGWGYLAGALLDQAPRIAALDLYEVDARALACTRLNLARFGERAITCHWHDVSTGLLMERHYDWIISNPPFHRGRAAEPKIGQSFITAAARALAPRGQLLLVANRQLPYERTLGDMFTDVALTHENETYKIITARGIKAQPSSGQRSRRR